MKNLTELKMCHKSGKRWQMQAERDRERQQRFKLVGVEFFLHFVHFYVVFRFKDALQTAGTAHR